MKAISPLFTLFLACTFAFADIYLTPLDFGLKLIDHGTVDYVHTPPNVRVGLFNNDRYPDIARFEGNKLQVFLFQGAGYTPEPQLFRTFDQPIQSLGLDDDIWDGIDDLVVTLADGRQETFCHRGGCLCLEGSGEAFKRSDIPRRVSEADFQIVWESEPRPWGMDRCAVGDLDNDGINELVTWYKESHYADTAYALIYKCVGDDQYELFMEDPLFFETTGSPFVHFMIIADLDQNGQKELIYTFDRAYMWEFSAPGTYVVWNSSISFPRLVTDGKVTDVDQDSIPELSFVTSTYGSQPPAMYMVEEFGAKSPYPWHSYVFNGIWTAWQDWIDDRLAVGDFDNDGAVDIVSGNAGMVWCYDPVDIQFYRYDSSGPPYFVQNWLHTGIPLSCVTPVIADFDNDGENELFAGGLFPNGGSAFVWEGTGLGTGYVSWLDTTSSPNGPNEASFGQVDFNPSVISIHILPGAPDDSKLLLWSFVDSSYFNLWQSPKEDSIAYRNPYLVDIDNDSKKNILLAGAQRRKAVDWEQVSAGIWNNQSSMKPKTFQLHHNYPNPFNSITMIPFDLACKSDITLTIYDVSGRKVYQYQMMDALPGSYLIEWDALSSSSGIYLINLSSDQIHQVKKAVLLK